MKTIVNLLNVWFYIMIISLAVILALDLIK